MLLVGWQEGHPACKKTEWWSAGVVVCLERGADLHMAQLMPLLLTISYFSEIQIALPFWYRLVKRVYIFWLAWRRHGDRRYIYFMTRSREDMIYADKVASDDVD